MSAVKRWVNWQIGSRFAPGPVVVNFVNNTKLLVAPGMTGATGNIYAGLHEFNDMAFALHLLRPGDLFIDVGANVGTYTMLAAAVGAKTISLEPIEAAFDHLMLNVRLNDVSDSVNARRIGVGSCAGIRRFTSGLDTVNHVVAANEEPGTAVCEVEVDTLDNIVAGSSPTLLKIDVEGSETEVLMGAEKVLSNPSLLGMIVELNGSGSRYQQRDEDIFSRILKYGFRPYSYDPQQRSLTALEGKNRVEGNTIFVRDFDIVTQRLRTAPRFSVLDKTF